MARPNVYPVPYLPNGNLAHYTSDPPRPHRMAWQSDEQHARAVNNWETYEKITWRERAPFEDTLLFCDGGRAGRSSIKINFVSKNDSSRKYVMFLQDFLAVALDKRWQHGEISATFIAVKRGQNYAIKLHAEGT